MKGETRELARKLHKFSKEQIIKAISESWDAQFFLEGIIRNLEYAAQKDLLERHSSAIDAERQAAEACMNWRSEMCGKYGNGGTCKLSDIPEAEIQKGARLESEWKKAQEKERALDKQVNKMLNLGGTQE